MSIMVNTYADDVTVNLRRFATGHTEPSQGHSVPKEPDKSENWTLDQFCEFWTKFDFLKSKPKKDQEDEPQMTNMTSDGEDQEEEEHSAV